MSIFTVRPFERKNVNPDDLYVFTEEDLRLNPNDPQMPYTRNTKNLSPSWGQLKLFLSVVEFLYYYYSKGLVSKKRKG